MQKVLIVCSGFTQAGKEPIQMLEQAGLSVSELDYGPGGLSKNEDEFCRIVKGIDALIVSVEKVTRRVIENADRLKIIALRGVGYDGIDLLAATDHQVLVTHNMGMNRKAVADKAMGLMLAVSRRIPWMDKGMREGKFNELRILTPGIYERTLGIIGLGQTGKTVALRAKGFDMTILYHDIVEYADFARNHGIKKVSLDKLLRNSDIITIHLPLDESTRNIIGKKEIMTMKKEAILINTARGGIVNEKELYHAITNGHLYGYGADVHENEPPLTLDLIKCENVVSTPHMAGISLQSSRDMAMMAAKKVLQYLKEKKIPENLLNPEVFEKRKQL